MEAKPTHFNRLAIEGVAKTFAEKVGYRAGQPLEQIVTKLGGEILVQHSSKDGELEVQPGGKFVACAKIVGL